jgi:hypothetical protein
MTGHLPHIGGEWRDGAGRFDTVEANADELARLETLDLGRSTWTGPGRRVGAGGRTGTSTSPPSSPASSRPRRKAPG